MCKSIYFFHPETTSDLSFSFLAGIRKAPGTNSEKAEKEMLVNYPTAAAAATATEVVMGEGTLNSIEDEQETCNPNAKR